MSTERLKSLHHLLSKVQTNARDGRVTEDGGTLMQSFASEMPEVRVDEEVEVDLADVEDVQDDFSPAPVGEPVFENEPTGLGGIHLGTGVDIPKAPSESPPTTAYAAPLPPPSSRPAKKSNRPVLALEPTPPLGGLPEVAPVSVGRTPDSSRPASSPLPPISTPPRSAPVSSAAVTDPTPYLGGVRSAAVSPSHAPVDDTLATHAYAAPSWQPSNPQLTGQLRRAASITFGEALTASLRLGY